MYSKNRLPKFVKKKDRTTQKFDKGKLESCMLRVLKHVGEKDESLAIRVAHETCTEVGKTKSQTTTSDKIRRAVCKVLRKNKMPKGIEYYECVFLHIKGLKIRKVVKRDGRVEKFNPHKIFKSIRKVFSEVGIEDGKTAEKLTKDVISILEKKYGNKPVPVESIKEDVEYVLVKNKFPQVAKAYILYRYM